MSVIEKRYVFSALVSPDKTGHSHFLVDRRMVRVNKLDDSHKNHIYPQFEK